MSVNRKYFDMGKGTDTTTTSSTGSVFNKATLDKAIDLLQKQQQAAEDAMIYGTSFTHVDPAGMYSSPAAKDKLHNLYNNLQQQYNQQRMSQLAQEYARRQQEQLTQKKAQFDELHKILQQQQQPAPYTDPPPSVANSPTCPQCSRLLLRTDATWTANHYYWTCIYHGLWRKLDNKVIPPHPDDSDNCGHWVKDGMLWVCERQRWECVECRNVKEDTHK